MHVLVTGSTGLIGSATVSALRAGGHRVTRLVRAPSVPGEASVHWDPAAGAIETGGLEGLDGVVHLAGEGIAAGRWTPAQKAKIRDSRVQGTRLLCDAIARCARPPRVLVCASAVGYYGDRGEERLTEESPPGRGFLAEVGRAWEAAAEAAIQRGIRVVHLRFGMVLSLRGGALAKMLLPFKLGVGGIVGHGRQYWSWISLDDVVGVIQFALATDTLRGPVNVVAPQSVTNREWTRALGRAVSRPTVFPMPTFAARWLFGEMADELLLASTRVVPERLNAAGYSFRDPTLAGYLTAALS